jgi:AcrR family transcriptional regulator
MFNTKIARKNGPETRQKILRSALEMFRERGFDGATIREVAKRAGVALGAAYYYFPSKEAIVQEYYDAVGNEHALGVRAAFEGGQLELEDRLRVVYHQKLEILRNDRRILGALFRYTGEPGHPLSIFGRGTQENREKSMELFRLALEGEKLPEDLQAALPLMLWALQMAMLLYFLYDESPEQRRTHKLIDSCVGIVVRLLSLARLPLLKPFRGALFTLLRDAGLFSEPTSPAPISLQEEAS